MRSVSKVRRGRNRFVAEATDEVYVGLDVHKISIHVGVWKNGEVIGSWVAGSNDPTRLLKKLELLRPGLKSIVYEAGPTGFALVIWIRHERRVKTSNRCCS